MSADSAGIPMTYDVVTIGSATVDYFADTDSELIRIDTRLTSETLLAYPLGGKILIKELTTTTGGGGTNTATAFKRLGFEPLSQTPKEFGAFLDGELKKWPPLLAAAGIKAQ